MKKMILILVCIFSLTLQAMEEKPERAFGFMNVVNGRLIVFSDGVDSVGSPNFFELLGNPFPGVETFNLQAGLEPVFKYCERVLFNGKDRLSKDVFIEATQALVKAKVKYESAIGKAISNGIKNKPFEL